MPPDRYSIGSYYYPGWKSDLKASPPRDPWDRIRAFPEREPLLGWYDDGDVAVMEQQLQWMHEHGLDFVVFDWYWTSNRPRIEHALQAYRQSRNKRLVKYSLMYANHENYPKSRQGFAQIVRHWVDNFMKDAQYQRIDGKPVLHVFSPQSLEAKAKAFGSTTAELLDDAQQLARSAGLPGIYFTAGTPAREFAKTGAAAAGYQALTAYNYAAGAGKVRGFDSFETLDRGYREHWDWILTQSPLPYFVPMSSGWDKRPWGGSKDPKRDLSVSTPDSFETHLRAAKAAMDSAPDKTHRIGIICCWNEYGEGSYIEPTKRWGLQYLERIKLVFGR